MLASKTCGDDLVDAENVTGLLSLLTAKYNAPPSTGKSDLQRLGRAYAPTPGIWIVVFVSMAPLLPSYN